MLGDVRFQPVEGLLWKPKGQQRVGEIFHRAEADLVQPPRLVAGEGPVGEVAERGAAPERQRGAQAVRRRAHVPGSERLPSGGHQPFELYDVDVGRCRFEHVAAASAAQPGTVGEEHPQP